MKDYLNKLSNEVIGAAFAVHQDLGSGLLESTCELSLQHELKLRDLASERKLVLPIRYKDRVVAEVYRIDILVENVLVINFHPVRLTDGIKRLVHNFPS